MKGPASGSKLRAKLTFQDGDIALKLVSTATASSAIIGPKGAIVKDLRDTYGVGVCILNPEEAYPGIGSQCVILSGQREQIDEALTIVGEKIATDPNVKKKNSKTGDDEVEVTLILSKSAVSNIIGKGGQTIKELRSESGCNFAAVQGDIMGEQLFHITGSPDRIPTTIQMLTPFIELAGDSADLALQDYADGGYGKGQTGGKKGGGGGGFGKAVAAYEPPHGGGGGKGKAGKGGVIGAAADNKGGGGGKSKGKGHSDWDNGGYNAKGGGQGGKLSSLSRPVAMNVPEPPMKRMRGGYDAAPPPMMPGDSADGPEAACQDPLVLQSESTIAFYIPSDTIGKVLGKAGSIANEIRSASGCQLKIESGDPDATVTLSGSLEGVHAAHCMVVARVMSEI